MVKKKEVMKKVNLPAAASAFFESSMGNADSDSFAIPFLTILQSNSPQCDEDDAAYIEGAKKGLIYNTVNREMYKEIDVFPCFFSRQFIEWIQRKDGGGLVAKHNPEDHPHYEITEIDGKFVWLMENGHTLVDSRQHYVLYRVEGVETWSPALMTLASSQIKNSKRLMTVMGEGRRNGRLFAFPFTTKGESNDKGSWSGWDFGEGRNVVDDAELLAQAKEFQESVKSGAVTVEGEDLSAKTEEQESPTQGQPARKAKSKAKKSKPEQFD